MPSGYQWNWSIVWQYRVALAMGAKLTLELLLICEVLGLALGLIAGLGRISRFRFLAGAFSIYIEIFRGTPALVQLFWFYYALPILFDIRIPAFETGVMSLTLFSGAYMAEIFRTGFQSIHRGQMLAARALGLSYSQAMWAVIIPQGVRRMIPPLISQSVDLFKATALASTITIPELMFQTYTATSYTFKFVEFYTVAAFVYFLIAFPLTWYTRRLEVSGVRL